MQTLVTERPLTTTADWKLMRHFLGHGQRRFILEALRGEGAGHFVETIERLAKTIRSMPKTMETDGQGDSATVYLHYFGGNGDWYVTERDCGDPHDETKGQQIQAFGYVCWLEDEMGYINIQELIQNGIELDFHFTPRSLGDVKIEREFSRTAAEFRTNIGAIAGAIKQNPFDVYKQWREYSQTCADGDQCPVMVEFINWNAQKWGKRAVELADLIK